LTLNNKIPPSNDNIPTIYPQFKSNEYMRQDIIAGRLVNNYITSNEAIQLLAKYNYRCIYCHITLNLRSWSINRIDNSIGHKYSNV